MKRKPTIAESDNFNDWMSFFTVHYYALFVCLFICIVFIAGVFRYKTFFFYSQFVDSFIRFSLAMIFLVCRIEWTVSNIQCQ